jgi:hypothetical protein
MAEIGMHGCNSCCLRHRDIHIGHSHLHLIAHSQCGAIDQPLLSLLGHKAEELGNGVALLPPKFVIDCDQNKRKEQEQRPEEKEQIESSFLGGEGFGFDIGHLSWEANYW